MSVGIGGEGETDEHGNPRNRKGGGLLGGGGGGFFKNIMGNSEHLRPRLSSIRFDDVCGADEAKEDLVEVVKYLREPERFTRLGGKLPKGVLLIGPPGCGKTLLAKAVAGEAGVPFFYAGGSEFDEMFVGVGAQRVRQIFAEAKRSRPSIVFIDELDAIGSKRTQQMQKHSNQALNQLLVELDGFDSNETEGVIIMAATNLPDALDPALTRPGRFDRHVTVPLPDLKARKDILKVLYCTVLCCVVLYCIVLYCIVPTNRPFSYLYIFPIHLKSAISPYHTIPSHLISSHPIPSRLISSHLTSPHFTALRDQSQVRKRNRHRQAGAWHPGRQRRGPFQHRKYRSLEGWRRRCRSSHQCAFGLREG